MILIVLLSICEHLRKNKALLHLLFSIGKLALETIVEVLSLMPKISFLIQHFFQLLGALLPKNSFSTSTKSYSYNFSRLFSRTSALFLISSLFVSNDFSRDLSSP